MNVTSRWGFEARFNKATTDADFNDASVDVEGWDDDGYPLVLDPTRTRLVRASSFPNFREVAQEDRSAA